MSDVIPFPKPLKPNDDETEALLKLLDRIANSSKSKNKNKDQER